MICKLYLNAGQMKAGTTFLYSVIKHHPEIYFTPEKELHFLSQHYGGIRLLSKRERLRKADAILRSSEGELQSIAKSQSRIQWVSSYLESPDSPKWYENVFDGLKPEQFAADFSNLTSTIPAKGLRRMHKTMPNIHLTYCFREPKSRAFSHVKFHLEFAGQPTQIASLSERKLRSLIRSRDIRPQGQTGEHVQKLVDVFGEDRVRLIKCEDMWKNPDETVSNLFDYLGIKPHCIDDNKNHAVNVGPTEELTPTIERILHDELSQEIEDTDACIEKFQSLIISGSQTSAYRMASPPRYL